MAPAPGRPRDPWVQGGIDAVEQWQEHPTSGVIAFNDNMAIGFMKAAQRLGLDVPGDVSVVGVDNSISALLTTPTLTTVSPQPTLVGAHAGRALLSQLKRRSSYQPESIVVPMELIAREPTGPAR